jgi:Zn-finger nucleic acid-binding protein
MDVPENISLTGHIGSLGSPQCGEEMDKHPYGGGGNVIIEDCERCSLNWLDYGELERIVQAPDREYASDL